MHVLLTSHLSSFPPTVFAGKDASRALALSSTKAEDARADFEDLDEKQKATLDDWQTFFQKRYNVVARAVPDDDESKP